MTRGKTLYYAYLVLVGLYSVYAWYSYSGLFRLAAETQLQYMDSYSIKLTLLLTALGAAAIGAVPLYILAKAMGVDLKAVRQEVRSASRTQSSKAMPLVMVALLAIVVSAVAGFLGYQQATTPITVADVDLAKPGAPVSGHAKLSGVVVPNYTVKWETKTSGNSRIDTYIPIVAPGWKPGEPITYFMRTGIDMMQRAGTGEYVALTRGTAPFDVKTTEGVLLDNGLPGQVAEVYHKNNVPIAATPVVFDTRNDADLDVYWITAGVSGMLGFAILVAAALTAFRQRRLARMPPQPTTAEWER